MGKLEGQVVFITGVARGMGRAHAVAFAREGARVIGIDVPAPISTVPYPLSTANELDETVQLVREAGGQIYARQADVRDLAALTEVVGAGVAEFGRLDFVIANAGINSFGKLSEMDEATFEDVIDVNLTGVWKTIRASAEHLIRGDRGGCILVTSSTSGLTTMANIGHYCAAKHGLTGLVREFANELGPHRIRVNSVHPSNTRTVMGLDNDLIKTLFRPDLENPTVEDVRDAYASSHVLPDLPWMQPEDISEVMVFLCSEAGRYITGAQVAVDAGMLVKNF